LAPSVALPPCSRAQGAFFLIENELKDVRQEELHNNFQRIAAQFPYGLTLQKIDSINRKNLRNNLEQGKFIFFQEDEVDYIARCLHLPVIPSPCQQVIRMALTDRYQQELQRDTHGYTYLLEQYFLNEAPSNWPDLSRRLEPEFGLPIQLVNINTLSNSTEQLEHIAKNQRTFQVDTLGTYIYFRLAKSEQLLKLGPIPYQKSSLLLNLGMIGALSLGVISGLILWLWPLWRDLRKLKQHAQAVEDGDFTSRTKLGRLSDVQELGDAFNTMTHSIETLVKTNQHITNGLAHDLRTPLARLRLAFEMIESDDFSVTEKQSYKKTIHASLDTLDYLVNQMLVHARYSRVADDHHFAQVALADVLEEEIELYQDTYDTLEIRLNIDEALTHTTQRVDEKAFIRVLDNLVSNAARYANTRIDLTLSLQNGQYTLDVEDDGPGVLPSDYGSIFEVFTRTQHTSDKHETGHGMGLAIVKNIAAWHGGSVCVGVSAMHGAKFSFFWPE